MAEPHSNTPYYSNMTQHYSNYSKVLLTLLKHVGIFMVWVLVWLVCALVTAPTITSTATISIAEAVDISLVLVDITR